MKQASWLRMFYLEAPTCEREKSYQRPESRSRHVTPTRNRFSPFLIGTEEKNWKKFHSPTSTRRRCDGSLCPSIEKFMSMARLGKRPAWGEFYSKRRGWAHKRRFGEAATVGHRLFSPRCVSIKFCFDLRAIRQTYRSASLRWSCAISD